MAVCLATLGLLGSSCAGGPEPLRERLGASESFAVVTAPPSDNAREELLRLRGRTDVGSCLRRAFLMLETNRSRDATRELNQVIFGSPRPRDGIEATARYLRGRAFAMQGDSMRAGTEFARAAELAVDQSLVAALRRVGAPVSGSRKAAPSRRTVHIDARNLQVLSRRIWNADAASRMKPMSRIGRITVHHTANATAPMDRTATAQLIKGIQRHHVRQNGWADIGYHFLVDLDGRVWQGRPTRWQGAHAGGSENRGNIGICLLGRFVRGAGGQQPTPIQVAALEALILRLSAEHGLDPGSVYTHRELATTQCPGDLLQREMDVMRRHLAGRGRRTLTARR